MAKFADREGREWTVEITHGHVGPLKLAGFDLKAVLDKEDRTFVDLLDNAEQFLKVMWLLCGPEAKAANITQTDFGLRFNGRAGEDAVVAVCEAVCEYFPQTRKVAAKMGAAFREMLAMAGDAAVGRVDAELDRVRTELTSTLSGTNSGA